MGLESTYFNLKHRLVFVFEPVNNIEKYGVDYSNQRVNGVTIRPFEFHGYDSTRNDNLGPSV